MHNIILYICFIIRNMKPEEAIDFHIKRTWHSIFKMYNQIAVKHDISQAIGFVLLYIDEKGGTPATSIAPLMGMEATSMSRLLKSMEEKKLIYKKPDETDKRMVRIYLTDLGIQKRKIARKVVRGFNESIISKFNKKEMEVMIQGLQKISDLTSEYKELKVI